MSPLWVWVIGGIGLTVMAVRFVFLLTRPIDLDDGWLEALRRLNGEDTL